MDCVPPHAAALIVTEHLKVIIFQNLIECFSVHVVKRLRGWCVFPLINDQFERTLPKLVRHGGPIPLDFMSATNDCKGVPYAGVPIENGAPGIEAKSFHIA